MTTAKEGNRWDGLEAALTDLDITWQIRRVHNRFRYDIRRGPGEYDVVSADVIPLSLDDGHGAIGHYRLLVRDGDQDYLWYARNIEGFVYLLEAVLDDVEVAASSRVAPG